MDRRRHRLYDMIRGMKHPATDSDKIKLIPEMMDALAEINRILITGNTLSGEPGLLEIIRNIKSTVDSIKEKQVDFEKLEGRVDAIEQRHRAIDEQKKRRDNYTLAMFSIALSNVIMIILWLLGFGR